MAHFNPLMHNFTAQKMTFYIKDFFSKCDQIRRNDWICLNLLKKYFMENFIFCTVTSQNGWT